MGKNTSIFLTCAIYNIIALLFISTASAATFEIKGDLVWGGVVTLEFSSSKGFNNTDAYLFQSEPTAGVVAPWFYTSRTTIDTVNLGIFGRIAGDVSPCYDADDKLAGMVSFWSASTALRLATFREVATKISCQVRLVFQDRLLPDGKVRNQATLNYTQVTGGVVEAITTPLILDMSDFKVPSTSSAKFSVKWNSNVVSSISKLLPISTLELSVENLPSNALIPIIGVANFGADLRGYSGRNLEQLRELATKTLFAPFLYGFNQDLKCADDVRLLINPTTFSGRPIVYIATGTSPKTGVCKIPFTKAAFSLAFTNTYTGFGFNDISFDDEAKVSVTLQVGHYTNTTADLGKVEQIPFNFGFAAIGSIVIIQIAKNEPGYFAIDKIHGDQDLFERSTGIWISYNIWDYLKGEQNDPIEKEIEQFQALSLPSTTDETSLSTTSAMGELWNPFNPLKSMGITMLELGKKKKYNTSRKSHLAMVTVTLDPSKSNSATSFDYTIGKTKGYMSLASTSVSKDFYSGSELTYSDDHITHNFQVSFKSWFAASELTGADIPVQARFRIFPTREFRDTLADYECTPTQPTVTITKSKFANDYLDPHFLTYYNVDGTSTAAFNITCKAQVGSIAGNLDTVISTVVWTPRGLDVFAFPSITTGIIANTTAIRAKYPPLPRFIPDVYMTVIVGEIKSQVDFEKEVQYAIDLINSQKAGNEPGLQLSDLRFIAPFTNSLLTYRNAYSSPYFGRNFNFDVNSASSFTSRGSYLSFAIRKDFLPETVLPSRYCQRKGFGGFMANERAIVQLHYSTYSAIGVDVQAKYLGGLTSSASFATLSFEEQQVVQTDAQLAAAFGGLPAGAKCESSSQCDEDYYCYESQCTVKDELNVETQAAVHALTGGDASFGVSLYPIGNNSYNVYSIYIAIVFTFIALLF